MSAAASASGLVLSTALSSAFARCDVSTAARANTTALLFGEGAIVCSDNNNKGHLRLVANMELVGARCGALGTVRLGVSRLRLLRPSQLERWKLANTWDHQAGDEGLRRVCEQLW